MKRSLSIIDDHAAHALFGGPSSMERHLGCPGNVDFCRDIPKPKAGPWAEEGTVFHEVMKACIKANPHFKRTFLYSKILRKIPQQYKDMPKYVLDSMDRLCGVAARFRQKHTKVKILCEVPVKLTEDIWGTCDLIIYGLNRVTRKWDILVLDWKYGKGKKVKVKNNLQCITYILAAIKEVGLKDKQIGKCACIIAQMRINRKWEENIFVFPGSQLKLRREKILRIVERVKRIYMKKEKRVLKAGSYCFFCRGYDTCPEQRSNLFGEVQDTAEELG